jgi:hypothetical protein
MDKGDSNTGGERNVTVEVRRAKCQMCPTIFETRNKFRLTCSDACRQRKWRGQIIQTTSEFLEKAFGAHAAERLQAVYLERVDE